MINILYLHNKVGISGGERSLLNLWKVLDREKFVPHLCLPERGILGEEAEKLGVKVFYAPVPKIELSNIIDIWRIIFVLKRYIRVHGVKIIHSCTPRNNIISAVVGLLGRIKVIWHERVIPVGNEPDISRKFMFLPNTIICNSHAVALRFEKRGEIPKKVKIILNGVDLKKFNSQTESRRDEETKKQKIVGVITNLTLRKRVEFFLEAAAKIYKKNNNVSFVVVGGEFGEESLERMMDMKKLATNLGIEECITFTGFVEDVKPYLDTFDIFAHVTVEEACSRAILEAMASGKPVVAMDSGGNSELVENGISGILTDPNDMESFVNTIVDLLRDDKRCLELGSEARIRAEKLFNVERNARETEAVYQELVHDL